MKKWMLVTLMGVVLTAGCAGTETAPEAAVTAEATPAGGMSVASTPPAAVAPEFREVTIPAGTTLPLDLKSTVASDSSHVEDAVKATLRAAIAVDGREVLPAGTELVGRVTEADDSGRVKGRARIAFRFTTLNHQGESYEIATAAIARQAEATKGEDATKIGIGAGAGAALGALLGGGDGAAKGAAIGGAAGTGVVLATKGKEVRLGPGANVATRLTAPVTLRIRVKG